MRSTLGRSALERSALERSALERSALGRSFDVYYRDTARTRRMDRLNAIFVPDGGLAFDIGAHVGDRTASFRRMGASVVSLEPQPRVFRALRLIHGKDSRVSLVCKAVGAAFGEVDLHLNAANPTVATASTAMITAAPTAQEWQGQVWDKTIRVAVTTLDQLIADHGVPDFIKIDVEGFEAEVLRGLSAPVRMISFEFTTLQRDVAYACLNLLHAYEFNVSLGEDHTLRPDWVTANAMHQMIRNLPASANSGDVYARLKGW